MRAYSAIGPSESGTGPKTMLNIIGATTVRPSVYDIILGCSGTPADAAVQAVVGRTTAVGTSASSAPTPNPVDPGDVAAVATVGWTHSAEPTYAATALLDLNFNQRTPVRWVANPGYELRGVASANNGIGAKNHASTSALVLRATIFWWE